MKLNPPLQCVAFLLFCIQLWSCRGCFKGEFMKGPEPINEIVSVELPVSAFHLPIHYELRNFENWINKVITGKFLETKINPQSDKREEALLVFTRTDRIKIKTEGNQMVCIFPLKVDAAVLKSRYGQLLTRQVKPISTRMVVELITPVKLNSKWNFVTKFKIRSVQWIQEPVLQVGPFKHNLTKRINEWLADNKSRLAALLDQTINESVTLEPVVSRVWNNLQKPILIHKKKPFAWMKFSCDSIEGNIVLNQETVTCYTMVKAKVMMMTDTALLKQPTKLPPFVASVHASEQASDIYLYAFVSFDEINDEVNRLLKGKTVRAKGYTVSIKHIRVYASTEGLSVEIKTGKDVRSKMVASGRLEFDPHSQTMRILNFDYAVGTNDNLVNAGDQLLHSMIRDTIASRLILNLDSLILTVPQLVKNSIAKGRAGNLIDITLAELHVSGCEIKMGADRIHFKIHAAAEADLKIKTIRAGEKLNINTTKGRK